MMLVNNSINIWMIIMAFSEVDKDKFSIMVDSLKKSRRADLSDIGKNIIDRLYVDPLDNNSILKSMLKPNTTILMGRRGTGKSTIIAKLQHDIRKSTDKLSLYVDVKTIFEQSKLFNFDHAKYEEFFTHDDLHKYLLYKSFLKEIIEQIKSELKTNTLQFLLGKLSASLGPNKDEIEKKLNKIFLKVEEFEYIDISLFKTSKIISDDQNGNSISAQLGGTAQLDSNLNIKAGINTQLNSTAQSAINTKEEYSKVLLKCFNPIPLMREIKKLLESLGIKYIYVCLDDFSEIDYDAMQIFVDVIVAPLNNLSDEFFKFKIAAYPGRVYLGDLDPQKIEQIKLDFYDLYQARTITNTHLQAQESIKNLIEKRISYFCKKKPEDFFDISKVNMIDYYKLLFDITASVPRNIGWILWYANQQSITKDKKITIGDLQIAAEKHYLETIQPYFSQSRFMREPFNMKLEKYHLQKILFNFLERAKTNKREIGMSDSKIFELDKARPPTSHFYVNKQLEEVLQPLEMQFIITKYNEQKDQDSRDSMSFFSLNYGLCVSEDIHYGRGADRKYVIQRRFNNTPILVEYLKHAQYVKCNNPNCNASHDYEELAIIERYQMRCPTCIVGICTVEHTSSDYISVEEDASILLAEFDMQLINSLKIDAPQHATALAQELDCTYQKVGRVAKRLKTSGLLEINKDESQRSYYSLTENTIATYFS